MTPPPKFTLKHSYSYYLSTTKEPVPKQEYLFIVYEFMKFIMNKVWEGHTVKFLARMGSVALIGKKIIPKFDEQTGEITNLAVDFKATNELWKNCEECKEKKQKIYHMNEHSNNIRYSIFWSKKDILVEHQALYTLDFSRTNRRTVPQLINQGKEYIVKEPKQY